MWENKGYSTNSNIILSPASKEMCTHHKDDLMNVLDLKPWQ